MTTLLRLAPAAIALHVADDAFLQRRRCGARAAQVRRAGGAGAAPSPSKGTGMGDASSFEVVPIGHVESTLTDRSAAPMQGHEGAPEAWLVFAVDVADGLDGLRRGDEVLVLTWLDRARRDVLRVHPRSDPTVPEQGVFTTRSPDRPNPIGLHPVEVLAVDGPRVRVGPLEALDGTPVLDVKPVLRVAEGRR
jgi:tRNA-Thr(GGU) m(6)t(6)A37 methyltransferase TsaA